MTQEERNTLRPCGRSPEVMARAYPVCGIAAPAQPVLKARRDKLRLFGLAGLTFGALLMAVKFF